MWPKKYKDYPEDAPLIHEKVQPGRGIIGCEMHDINGWGISTHRKKRKKNLFSKLLAYLFGTERESLHD